MDEELEVKPSEDEKNMESVTETEKKEPETANSEEILLSKKARRRLKKKELWLANLPAKR